MHVALASRIQRHIVSSGRVLSARVALTPHIHMLIISLERGLVARIALTCQIDIRNVPSGCTCIAPFALKPTMKVFDLHIDRVFIAGAALVSNINLFHGAISARSNETLGTWMCDATAARTINTRPTAT